MQDALSRHRAELADLAAEVNAAGHQGPWQWLKSHSGDGGKSLSEREFEGAVQAVVSPALLRSWSASPRALFAALRVGYANEVQCTDLEGLLKEVQSAPAQRPQEPFGGPPGFGGPSR